MRRPTTIAPGRWIARRQRRSCWRDWRTLHASAALRAGAIQQALLLAERSETIEPVSSDEFLDLISAFVQSGHPEEADVLRNNATKGLTSLLAEFPDGPMLENNLAWLPARGGGNLDDALAHATHAAQLDPHSAAIADTLAEVYFRRGELGKAVETMQKCVALAPNQPREQKRLEQFQAALANKQSQN